MSLALLLATIVTFVVFDTMTWHKFDLRLIFAKSCIVGLIFVVYALSSDYEFSMAVMSSLAVIALNFFLTLLVNFVLFLFYKYSKVTLYRLIGSFGLSYLTLLIIIFNLNSIFNGS